MKKLYLLLLGMVLAISFIGCTQETTTTEEITTTTQGAEFNFDGEFTAYEVSVHSNSPMVTYVTVTIEAGMITEYNIDVRQGTQEEVIEGETTTYTYMWNELTKKELGDDYNMKVYGTGMELVDGTWVQTDEKPENEWYEQAALIEAYLLENGVDSLEIIEDRISNVAGVTIKDSSYSTLAQEALNLAQAGTYQAIVCSNDDLYIAKMTKAADGTIQTLMLDVLQGDPDGDTFAWSLETKQEQGDDYNMKTYGDGLEYVGGEWVETGTSPMYEWYEQANLITDYIIANGWNESLAPLQGRSGTLDGTTLVDDLAGATIRTETIYDVLAMLFDKVG